MLIHSTNYNRCLNESYTLQLYFNLFVLKMYEINLYIGYMLINYSIKSNESKKKYTPFDPSPSLFKCSDGSKSFIMSIPLFKAVF